MSNKEYHRQYNLVRYYRVKAQLVQELGGKCVNCASEESLEFDHIDPSTKKFSLGTHMVRVSMEELREEAAKCQLLCKPCHIDKHRSTHGQYGMYRHGKCRCDLCKEANRVMQRQYTERRKARQ